MTQPEASLCYHPPAFLRALVADLRAFLAVLVFVLAALLAAGRAGIGAQAAHFFSMIAAQAHQLRRGIAKGCALHIQLDTAGHHVQVLFL